MTAIEYHKINGIIEQIQKVETMIKKAEARLPDPASELIVWQFERMKKDFIKQLSDEL